MFTVLKKCDITDINIPQEVKDFCEQVNKEFWPDINDKFEIYTNGGNNRCYSLALFLEVTDSTHLSIYIDNFESSNIKDATVGVTFEEAHRQRIYASIEDIPKDDVGRRAVQLYYWIDDQVGNPEMLFLDM